MPYSLPEILVKYKAAWESHNLSLLEEIFDSGIIYQEKPDSIFKGIEELKKYWLENKEKQQNVVFTILKSIFNEEEIIADWEASFFDRKKQINIHLVGFMWLTVKNNKIIFLKELFAVN